MKMKFNNILNIKSGRRWFIFYAMIFLPLTFLASCKKEPAETLNKSKPSVFQYIGQNKQLSLYCVALKRAGLYNRETFSNGGPFTVFAPVDSAFISAGLTADSVNRYDSQGLALALKYSIVNGKISSTSLVGFYSESAKSLHPLYKPNIVK